MKRLNQREHIRKRIERDKIARAKKKAQRAEKADNFEKVMTMQNYHNSLKKCKKGVMWKGKPQAYCHKAITNIDNTLKIIENGELPPLQNTSPIVLYERGKRRIIIPIQFDDRITQRVICDDSLILLVKPSLIYDNGASMQGKGTDFARKRAEHFLRDAIKEYGEDFYILIYDFKSFFDSIPHQTCFNVLNQYYKDTQISNLIMEVVKSYQRPTIMKIKDKIERIEMLQKLENNELNGICLGSQISQILALVVPNELDHFIKDKMRMKRYERYMNDGIIIHNDKSVLRKLYELIVGKKLIKTLVRSGTVRMRRKLKKFKKKVDSGLMKLDDVYESIQSWLAHAKLAKSHHTVKSMLQLYDDLFGGYKITKKYFRNLKRKDGESSEILQSDKWAAFRWNCNYCGTA